MTQTATFPLSTAQPLSYYGLHGGSREAGATNSSELPDFETWLFTKAQTEDGKFPDWPYLHEYARALASGRDLIVLKRRQILISWVTAAYWHYRASREAYCHGAVVSSGKTASSKQGRRIAIVAQRDGYDVHGVDLIKYPNGSEISILPSTEHAGVGESLKLGVHFDEFGFHRYAQSNLDTIRPAVSNSGGQTIITSTSNPLMGASGPFYEMWRDASDDERLFYGRWVRPDQGQEFIDAEMRRPGMSTPVMNAYYPVTPEDAFIAHAGLVFPEFSRTIVESYPKTSWKDCKYRVVGADPGGGDATAMLMVGVNQDETCVQVYAPEYYQHGGSSIDEYKHFFDSANAVGKVQAFPIGETGGSTIVTTLRRMGVPAEKAELKPDDNREWIRWLLEWGLLKIDPRCENLLREFELWRWRPGTDEWTKETYMTNVGGKRHHDLLDCLGYSCARVIRQLRASRPVLQATAAERNKVR